MKTKILFPILLLMFASPFAWSQNSFFKTYGSNLNGNIVSLIRVSTTDIIAGGRVDGNLINPSKTFIMRIHENGDTVWTQMLYNPDYNLRGFQVVMSSDSNVIVLSVAQGTTIPTQDFDYIHITKLNSLSGDTIWTTVTGSAGNSSNLSVHSVDKTSDGGCIISASMENTLHNRNATLIYLDNNGTITWRKSYALNSSNTISSPGPVKQTQDGGYIFTATSNVSRNGDILLIKTDSIGNVNWSRALGQHLTDGAGDIIITSDNNYLILGSTYVDAINHNDVFLSKVDFNGNVLWTKTYGTASLYGDFGLRVSETQNGDFIFGGGIQQTADSYYPFLIKTDLNGDTLWTFMSQDTSIFYFCSDVIQTSDGGFLSGCSKKTTPTLNPAAIIKIDASGHLNCSSQLYPINQNSVNLTDTTHTLVVTQLLSPSMPAFSTQTLQGLNMSIVCQTTVSIIDPMELPFSIYPNPAGEDICIHLKSSITGIKYNIYDATGRIVMSNLLNDQNAKLNVSCLHDGLYIFEIFSDQNYYRQKFMKQ